MGSPLCGYITDMSDGGRSVRPSLLTGPRFGSEACLSSEVEDCWVTWSPMDSSDTAADPRPRHVLYSPPTSGKNYVDLVTIRVLTFPEAVEVTQAILAAAR
jgi:hypothetical protein